MTRYRPSYYIKSSGPQDAALVRGMQWLVGEAQSANQTGVVAVSQLMNLTNVAQWSQLAPFFHELRNRRQATITGVSIELFTLKTQDMENETAPVLVVYGGRRLLKAVDALMRVPSVLYIPWQGTEHEDWAATWGASDLDAEEQVAQREPLSGVACTAINELTQIVNLATGIAHPSDYEQAVKTLETLYRKGAACTPETIRQQLIRLDWQPEDADRVKSLAEKIWQGRRPRSSTGQADDALWENWNRSRG